MKKIIISDFKIDLVTDGESINQSIITKYNLSHMEYAEYYSDKGVSKLNINFVGVILNKNSMLFSMPKNFMDNNDFERLSNNEKLSKIQLVLKSIVYNYFSKIENDDEISASFSIRYFVDILNYFNKYGYFRRDSRQIHEGNRGSISWKDTIKKSNKIVSGEDIIFLPTYVTKNYKEDNFITICMATILQHVIINYGQLLSFNISNQVFNANVNGSILNNKERTINLLLQIYNKTFKDIDRKLIASMIHFLHDSASNLMEENFKLCCYRYSSVWEDVVQKYLNDYFNGIKNDEIIFKEGSICHFSKEEFNDYNEIHTNKNQKNNFQPDHYSYLGESQYIFDSKYKTVINEVDYKQLTYIFVLREKFQYTYSALIMPSCKDSFTEQYFRLNKNYLNFSSDDNFKNKAGKKNVPTILKYHLNTIEALENYIS